MTAPVKLEVTADQQKLILEGLRYVQHSVALRTEDPTPESIAQRQADMQVIRELSAIVKGEAVPQAATV